MDIGSGMGQLGTARAGLFYMMMLMPDSWWHIQCVMNYRLQLQKHHTGSVCTPLDHQRNTNTFCVFICSSVYVISLSRELHSVTKFTFKLSDK